MKEFLFSWLKWSKEDWREVIKQIIISGFVAIIFSILTWQVFLIFELMTQLVLQPEIIVFFVGMVAIVSFLITTHRNIIHRHQIPAGRESEIRQLVRQIQTGQSSAVISGFGKERKNILDYLLNKETELFGRQSSNLVFSLLDISRLPKKCNQSLFWKNALMPLQEEIAKKSHFAPLAQAFKTCQNNNFENQYLEKLFVQMGTHQLRLVLMLHRFEVLLHRPMLNREEFLGGLRLLASSSHPSPLSVIISMKQSIKQFYQDIEHLIAGSPYLNFMGNITLGALSDNEIDELFNQSKQPFDEEDRVFIKDLSGKHPYLLQIAAACLLEARKDQKKAKNIFDDKIEEMLISILRSWDFNTCKAFIHIAHGYDVSGFRNELKELEKQGFIMNENNQWRVGSSVFAELVADKTIQELCKNKQSIKN